MLYTSSTISGQELIKPELNTNKGHFYIYWGYNRAWFTNSDLHFKGNDYQFTLKDVVAKDRQTAFNFDEYFHPKKFTIPQYNFRIGYFVNEHYSISIGTDHMKYVLQQNQIVKINGEINVLDSDYNGNYENEDFKVTSDFLQFEHTDGLNYGNIDIRRFDTLLAFRKIKLSMCEGLGFGILIPRTNTALLGHERYDRFKLSGYGFNALASLHLTFWDLFFIQSEFKGGLVYLPKIRTTDNTSDMAKQQFMFAQTNLLFGFQFKICK